MRGYLIGSGWKDYQKTGKVCGITLPAGLKEAEKLPQVLFTPSTKAPAGAHDENISFEEAEKIVGADVARQVRDYTIALYTHGGRIRRRQAASSSPTPSSNSAWTTAARST